MLKVHPTISKLNEKAPNQDVAIFEGLVGFSDKKKTRLYNNASRSSCIDIPTSAILHADSNDGDQTGKVRTFVDPDARVDMVIQMPAIRATAREANGTTCINGTMYCWRRFRLSDGSYVIIMEPCGSCPLDQAHSTIRDIVR